MARTLGSIRTEGYHIAAFPSQVSPRCYCGTYSSCCTRLARAAEQEGEGEVRMVGSSFA